MSPSNNSSVSTLASPFVTSINDKICSLQNLIKENIKYSDFSKIQEIYVCCASDILNKEGKLLSKRHGIM